MRRASGGRLARRRFWGWHCNDLGASFVNAKRNLGVAGPRYLTTLSKTHWPNFQNLLIFPKDGEAIEIPPKAHAVAAVGCSLTFSSGEQDQSSIVRGF